MNIPQAIPRHARHLHWIIALSGFVAAFLMVAVDWMKPPAYAYTGIVSAAFSGPLFGLVSIYISWAAIWGVLGVGSTTKKIFFSLALLHIVFALIVLIATLVKGPLDRPAIIACLLGATGFSYATIGQLIVSIAIVWLLKYFRVRMIFADDGARFKTLRQRQQPDAEIDPQIVQISAGRMQLKDLFALVTLFAIGFALWLPSLGGFGQARDSFLGPGFIFFLSLMIFAFNGAIGIVGVLLPMLVAMSARWKTRTQFVIYATLLLIASAATAVGAWMADDPAQVYFGVSCLTTFVCYVLALHRITRGRSNFFHFRLIRQA